MTVYDDTELLDVDEIDPDDVPFPPLADSDAGTAYSTDPLDY